MGSDGDLSHQQKGNMSSKYDGLTQRHDKANVVMEMSGLNPKTIFQRIQVKEEFAKSQSQIGRDRIFTRQRMRSQTPICDIMNPNHSVLLPSLSYLPDKLNNEHSIVFKSTFQLDKPLDNLHNNPLIEEYNLPISNPSVTNHPQNPYAKSKVQAITPELAATVVKNFILPMFDNDGKKLLKKKKLQNAKKRCNSLSEEIEVDSVPQNQDLIPDLKKNQKTNPTVFEELKLSQILQDEIYQLRGQIQVLQEEVQSLNREKNYAIREKCIIEKQSKRNFNIIHIMKSKVKKYEEETKKYRIDNARMLQQINQLKELFKYNENSRKKFSEQLQIEKNNNEKLGNQVIDIKQRSSLLRMENGVIIESLQRLYDAMESLGSAKITQDKYETMIRDMQDEKSKLVMQLDSVNIDLNQMTLETSDYQVFIKELQSKLSKIQSDKERIQQLFKEKYVLIEKEKKDLRQELQAKQDELQIFKQQLQQVTNEREKLKSKIIKMKRRRNIDLNQKICKKCGKEYLENENFNWSCRTHRSEYGGEMWWCCGKSQMDAQGCKFQKHESKDDEEDEKDKDGEGEGNSQTQAKKFKGSKCMCCKAKGHRTEDCDKDPNIRGIGHSVIFEDQRLSNRTHYKRYAKDAVEITQKLMEKLSKQNKQKDIFGQDIMMFDDYNYAKLNQYIFNQVLETLNSQEDGTDGVDKDDLIRSLSKVTTAKVLNENENKFDDGMIGTDEEARRLYLGYKNQLVHTNKRKIFNEDQIDEILINQCYDVFEDVIVMKNSNFIDNLKIKNMVNLDNFINDMINVETLKKRRNSRRGTLSISKQKSEIMSNSFQNSFLKSPVNPFDKNDCASDIALEYSHSPTGDQSMNPIDRKRSIGGLSVINSKPFALQPETAGEQKQNDKDKDLHQSNSVDFQEQNEIPLKLGLQQLSQNISKGIKKQNEKKKELQSAHLQDQNHQKNFRSEEGEERSSANRENSKIRKKRSEVKIKTNVKNQVIENNESSANSLNNRRPTSLVKIGLDSQIKQNQPIQQPVDLNQQQPHISQKRSLIKKPSKQEINVDEEKQVKKKNSSIKVSVSDEKPVKNKPKIEKRHKKQDESIL